MALRVNLTRFEQVSACLSGWSGTVEQVTRGPFVGSLQVAQGRHLRIMSIAGNQSVLVRGREAAGLCTVHPVLPANAGGTWRGRRLAPGQLVFRGPGEGIDLLTPRRSEYLGVTVPAAALEAVARALTGRDLPPAPRVWSALVPNPEDFDRLLRAGRDVLARGPATPPGRPDPELAEAEEACLAGLVRAVFPDAPAGGRGPSLPARAQAVRRAEELMRARLRDPAGVVELCAALGVSDRTLRLMFREHFGCGPMAYSRLLRLNAVRARLMSDPVATVAAAAREFGFTHLGNFAADYRRHFGESPSQTPRA